MFNGERRRTSEERCVIIIKVKVINFIGSEFLVKIWKLRKDKERLMGLKSILGNRNSMCELEVEEIIVF